MYQGAGKSAGQGGVGKEEGWEDEEGAHGRNVAGIPRSIGAFSVDHSLAFRDKLSAFS